MQGTSYARDARNEEHRVYALQLDAGQWRALQVSYKVGDLLMPCCDASAVPKTSPYGLQFFAHASGQCSASEEGQWHLRGKEIVAATAREFGISALIEHPSADGWRADVWLDIAKAPVAIEVQHSYQHLRDYHRRQARYRASGVRCLWLVQERPYRTLLHATMRQRWLEEFGRAAWPEGEAACLKDLPVALLKINGEAMVTGPCLHARLREVLYAFIENRFMWNAGAWVIGP